MTRTEDQILAALARVRPDLPYIGNGTLPKIDDAARDRTGRKLEHQRPSLGEIGKWHRVRRRCVRCEDSELVLEVEVIDVSQVVRFEHLALHSLPFRHRHVRQSPEVSQTGSLKVQLAKAMANARIVRFIGCMLCLLRFDFYHAHFGAGHHHCCPSPARVFHLPQHYRIPR
jgi:hypothetical protein